MPINDDTSTGEGRYGRQGVEKQSGWAAAIAIAITIIVVIAVVYYRAMLVAL
jgi:hypothetical protein